MNNRSPFTAANRQAQNDGPRMLNNHANWYQQYMANLRKQFDVYQASYTAPGLGCGGRLQLMLKRSVQGAVIVCILVFGYVWYANGYSMPQPEQDLYKIALTVGSLGAGYGLIQGLTEKRS